MLDDLLATLFRFGLEVLPISIVGWLGVWLLSWSAGKTEKFVQFGGPYTFLIIWGLAAFASIKTLGRASPLINTVGWSLMILGLLASLVRAVAGILRISSRRH